MAAASTHLVIEQGTDWSDGWAVTYNGAPIDATWDARGQIRQSVKNPVVLHQFAASVVPILDSEDEPVLDANGIPTFAVVVAVAPEDTTEVYDEEGVLLSGWSWRSGVYDVEIVNADESVTLRVAQGSVRVSPEVTR